MIRVKRERYGHVQADAMERNLHFKGSEVKRHEVSSYLGRPGETYDHYHINQ